MKVGGTSLEMALAPYCGPTDIITPISPIDEYARLQLQGKCQNFSTSSQFEDQYLELVKNKKFTEALNTGVHRPHPSRYYNHLPLSELETRLDFQTNQFTLLIAERSPYAKIISFANMQISFPKYDGAVMANSPEDIQKSISHLFRTGRYKLVRNIGLYQHKKTYKQVLVLRQESFKSDLMAFFERMEIGPVPTELPHAKNGGTQHLKPGALFTRAQLDLINKEYATEFKTFGYQPI